MLKASLVNMDFHYKTFNNVCFFPRIDFTQKDDTLLVALAVKFQRVISF